MATTHSAPRFFPISIVLLFFLINVSFTKGEFGDTIARRLPEETLTHMKFFWHDIVGGPNPTSITVVESASKEPYTFGYVNMIDNLLTVGPELDSKVLGRAEGFYAMASQDDYALLMIQNLVLMDGKFNGSTITLVGRNPVSEKVKEIPVMGGTGFFRLARGYALAKTYYADPNTGDATVEYNVYVTRFEGNEKDYQ